MLPARTKVSLSLSDRVSHIAADPATHQSSTNSQVRIECLLAEIFTDILNKTHEYEVNDYLIRAREPSVVS